jgi:hypothetical protein
VTRTIGPSALPASFTSASASLTLSSSRACTSLRLA